MAMKVFTEPSVLGAADTNEYLVNVIYADKATATTRVSTTILTGDPDLTLAVATNKTYWMDLVIPFTSPTAAAFKFTFFVPASSVFTGYALLSISAALSLFTYSSAGLPITNTITSGGTSGAGVDDFLTVRGTLDTAGTAGSVVFAWAQATSNAGNTIVRAGSAFRLTRVS